MDVIFSETEVVQPDILFVAKDRENIIKEIGVFGAPDLVIEIQSPSRELYDSQGVREYLLFYPEEKKALQYIRVSGSFKRQGMIVSPDPLALHIMNFSLDLKKVFE